MNTLIYLWVEPLMIGHKRTSDKIYFNCIVKGDFSGVDADELDNVLAGENMASIMDFADIQYNYNYAAIWAKRTTKPVSISFANSPEQEQDIKEDKKVQKQDIPLTKKNVSINDGGKLDVSIPELRIKDSIDFSKIWASLQKQFLGKIKAGDSFKILDDDGNELISIQGGNFLNVAVADLGVYAPGMPKDASIFDRANYLIGGLFVRDDGSIDIGDRDRTFYMKINTTKLLKASIKLNTSLMDMTQQKLLK